MSEVNTINGYEIADKKARDKLSYKNKVLWEGNLSYDVTNTESKDFTEYIDVPEISKYNIINVDGHIYHKTASEMGTCFICFEWVRAGIQNYNCFCIDIKTLLYSEEAKSIGIFRMEQSFIGSHIRIPIDINSNTIPKMANMAQFGINKIIGVI